MDLLGKSELLGKAEGVPSSSPSEERKLNPLAVFLATPLRKYLQAEIHRPEDPVHRAAEWNIV
jgi:hypothetical protein